MADPTTKVPENVPGRYYVDDTCIDCELCRETAPGNFERWDRGRYSFVSRQPEGPEEELACRSAMEECPVEAIGCDGDQAG
jgi:ferredoxin